METNGTTRIESFVERHGPPDIPAKAKLKDDGLNIFVLLVLYSIQAIPYGISLAIPIIIQNMHHSSFNEQAQFSLALWPYSMKLLWAPFVDSLFIRKLGRRKSWLVPVQYLLGIFFFATGFHINDWLVYASKPQINVLTAMFFVLNFLAATQDIAVDGWAITMLKRENISYASICNCAGQTIGEILGYVLLIVLISESFCNKWLRISPLPGGVITLQGYLYFWGVVYIGVTTLVAIFKSDKDHLSENGSVNMSMIETYKLLFRIMKLPNIKKLLIIIFTVGISFSAIDAAFKLKLMDGGVTKNEIATIEFLIIILQLSIPFLFIKFSSEGKPMTLFLRTVIYRLVIDVVIIVTIYFTPFFVVQTGKLFVMYKLTLVLIFILYQSMVFIVMLSTTAFYASISDPQIGGTYMTLLNTVANLGSIGSRTGALWLIDFLTYKRCSVDHTNTCSDKNEMNVCNSSGGTCQTFIDGFYTEALICTFYGMIWCWIFRKAIVNLQTINIGEWHVEVKKKIKCFNGIEDRKL